MPNWVRNKVLISGTKKDVDDLLKRCKTDRNEFSFEGIVPMPNEVDDWYTWCINKWGTKWDSQDADVWRMDKENASIVFETAWSAPIPVYEAIHKRYPNMCIDVEYADEDLGCNCGVWQNGYHSTPTDETAFGFACNVWSISEAEARAMYDL